jgi:hypothetical protein
MSDRLEQLRADARFVARRAARADDASGFGPLP